MRLRFVFVFFLTLFYCRYLTAQERPAGQDPTAIHYFENVREVFSGERAFETVAFMEQHWRLPGNSGFDATIDYLAAQLDEAGYVPEKDAGPVDRLTYRIETYEMNRPAWEPVDASLSIVGETEPLLRFEHNRNMVAINSFSTPATGIDAEVVYIGKGRQEDFDRIDVAGKIVFGEIHVRSLFREAVQERGAIGVLAYSMSSYTQPEINQHSITFSSISYDEDKQAWGLILSYHAAQVLREALADGPVWLNVRIETRSYPSSERTVVADVRGTEKPDERFVFSAHVQEPGANDNASGVAAQLEMARVVAQLNQNEKLLSRRTITFLWGDEIRSTRRYIEQDESRAGGILWGLSLDMVGEDTEKTGGTFLIEKMPDPSGIWTRGEESHTEWGSRRLSEDDMMPHYFNDFALNRCLDQAVASGWIVRTNPYEGGSDHVPFLRAEIPGLLFWHFTDQFYHTDGDRLGKVSPVTLQNAGTCAIVTALTLTTGSSDTAQSTISELKTAALSRLEMEYELSRQAVNAGNAPNDEARIINTWSQWYQDAIRTTKDIDIHGPSTTTQDSIEEAVEYVRATGNRLVKAVLEQ